MTEAYLHFQGEFRGIPSGRRKVQIKREGGYAYVRPVGIVTRRWSKMREDQFDKLFADWLPIRKEPLQ